MKAAAKRTDDDALNVRVVRLAELAFMPDGPTRGHGHIGFGEMPVGALGRLDFAPLLLFAHGIGYPGESIPMHRHENIENVMVMLTGAFEHRDSLGNDCAIDSSGVAVLSAGSGVEHAEHVHGDQTAHALVIWIRPTRADESPTFAHGAFARAQRRDRWQVLATGRADVADALPLRADAEVRAAVLGRGAIVTHEVAAGRRVYAIAIDGELEAGGAQLFAGDRLLVEGQGTLYLRACSSVEVVLVDMPCASDVSSRTDG